MGCCGGGFLRHREWPQGVRTFTGRHEVGEESPVDILRARLARGEITAEEYRQLLSVLQEATPRS